MHRLKRSLVGLRMVSLNWSDSVGKWALLSSVAVLFFLLGLATNLLHLEYRAAVFIKKVHTQRLTAIPETAAPPVIQIPIVPRIINANPISQPVLQGEQSGTRPGDQPVSTAAVANAANPTGLADVPQSTPAARSETEDRESVRCLKPAVLALLHAIEDKFGPVKVISTCRPGATIAGSDHPSRHRYGLAIDFVAPDGKRQQIVRWLVETHKTGGVMTYNDSDHIHVDIGPHFVSLAGERRERKEARQRRRSWDWDD